MRDDGQQHSVPLLVEGQFKLPDEDTPVFLRSICVGMTDAMAHYRDAGDVSVVLEYLQGTVVSAGELFAEDNLYDCGIDAHKR